MNFDKLMKKITKWIDPKLEKYRTKKPIEKFTPKTTKELIDVLRRCPENVLSSKEKNIISASMSLESTKAVDIMLKIDDMILVEPDEILGPLKLDELYKSGFLHFPILDNKYNIKGILHTNSLNSLEVKKPMKAKNLLTKDFSYISKDSSLQSIVDDFLRTTHLVFFVKDASEEIIGMITIEMLFYYFLGLI